MPSFDVASYWATFMPVASKYACMVLTSLGSWPSRTTYWLAGVRKSL